jgi:hypothetical protein
VGLVVEHAPVFKRIYLSFQVGDIPADMAEQAEEYREKLVELAVEQDDDAMEMYLEVRCGCRSGCSGARGDGAEMRLLPVVPEQLVAVLPLPAHGGATKQGCGAAAAAGGGATSLM